MFNYLIRAENEAYLKKSKELIAAVTSLNIFVSHLTCDP
jgi:hypothetical protein